MNRYPLFLGLKGRRAIIIGGGEAALRKARLVAAAGAEILFVYRTVDPKIGSEFPDAVILARDPVADDFVDAALAFVAVDEHDPAPFVDMARQAGVLVNVVDRPELCDFTTPSIIDRDRLTIAISTDGAGPVFGKSLREKIEAMLPVRAGALLDFAERYRSAIKANLPPARRRAFWQVFFDGPIASQFLAGDERGARGAMITALNEGTQQPLGVVHIVGAGPGDPELLTLKALRIIQSADIILHDRLVSDEIMALARRDAERFYVGKAKSDHAVPQSEIETTLIALARQGKIVVRLKGGDPFIFGRGGEELQTVRAAGIPVYVTPGITAATGCAAATGMALTHRDHAQSVTFVTGHSRHDAVPDLDWNALAALKNTLVVYMGVGNAPTIADRMIAAGRSGETPVAIIENGTRSNEILVKGRLRDLAQLVDAGGVKGPALLVIGEVATLADSNSLIPLPAFERLVA